MSDTKDYPSEKFLSLKEIAAKIKVNEYVVGFWIKEFSQFGFSDSENFSEKDLKLALLIKRLLYEECFTIKGVKRRLRGYAFENIDNTEQSKSEISDKTQNTDEEKKHILSKFSLDCKKKLDIISSEIKDIIQMSESDV